MAYVAVYSTAGSCSEADDIAEGLVNAKLAACVQMLPVKSVYRWKGSVEKSSEVLLVIKTRREASGKVIGWLRDHHSYEVPEAVVVDITGGLDAYLQWIDENVEV